MIAIEVRAVWSRCTSCTCDDLALEWWARNTERPETVHWQVQHTWLSVLVEYVCQLNMFVSISWGYLSVLVESIVGWSQSKLLLSGLPSPLHTFPFTIFIDNITTFCAMAAVTSLSQSLWLHCQAKGNKNCKGTQKKRTTNYIQVKMYSQYICQQASYWIFKNNLCFWKC